MVQNLSAVTGACLLTKRDVFEKINGLNEQLKVAFNDIDFCLRIRELGLLIVLTPLAELYHYESASRGFDVGFFERARMQYEIEYMINVWGEQLKKDPYYNSNLSLNSPAFGLKTDYEFKKEGIM